MKKLLILGAGYIGSEIIARFCNQFNITCISHAKSFDDLNQKYPDVRYIMSDIHDKELIAKHSFDAEIVVYAIDAGSVVSCIENPEKYRQINVDDFSTICDVIKDRKANFLLFSSSFVYPDVSNATENTKLTPETLYGKLRVAQENLVPETSTNYTILRLSNIYGYGKFSKVGRLGAIEKFIEGVFLNQKIFLHGNGTQKVDYLHMDDLMRALKILMPSTKKYQTYNIASGKSQSIFEVAKIIEKIALDKFKIKIDIIKLDEHITMPNSPNMSINKICAETSWRPKKSLVDNIENMMMSFYSKHKGNV